MLRVVEDFVNRPLFQKFPGVHNINAVSHPGNDTQVVGDEDDGSLDPLLQVLHQVQDFSLHSNVQGSSWFVSQKNFRFTDQGNGDNDSLPHTTRELVRVLVDSFFSVRNTNGLHHFQGLSPGFLLRSALVLDQWFSNLLADLHGRVQRSHWVLEDHGDLVTTDLLPFLFGNLQQVLAVEKDLPAHDLGVLGQKADDAPGGNGLA